MCLRVPLPSQVNKQTSELVFDHLHASAFQFSPLGRTILGPVENIKSLTRDQLVSYMKKHYRGPRMVSICAHARTHTTHTPTQVPSFFAFCNGAYVASDQQRPPPSTLPAALF